MEKISLDRAKVIARREGLYPAIAGDRFFYFVNNENNPNVVDWDEFTKKFNVEDRSIYVNKYKLKGGKNKGETRYYLQVR